MTDDMMALRGLLEKSSDADLLREMIGFTAQRLMALEVEGLTGASHGERSLERINHRAIAAGLETRAGTVELKIPKLRKGATSPPGAPPDGRKALTAVIQEAHPGRLEMSWYRPWACRVSPRPGVAALRRDRRQDPRLPRPALGGRLALFLDATYVKRPGALGRRDRQRPGPA